MFLMSRLFLADRMFQRFLMFQTCQIDQTDQLDRSILMYQHRSLQIDRFALVSRLLLPVQTFQKYRISLLLEHQFDLMYQKFQKYRVHQTLLKHRYGFELRLHL
jgi:hypothetical protein